MRRPVPMLAILSLLAATASGCGGEAPAAAPEETLRAQDLAAEVKGLRELAPDQAHIMADVGYHFTNLWFAGEAENWPLADFYLAETKSHLRWAVRAKPIRKDDVGRDINLPGISGLEVVSQLRADPALADTLCIALSADATPTQIERAMQAGFDDYWTKPLDVLELAGRLADALARHGGR